MTNSTVIPAIETPATHGQNDKRHSDLMKQITKLGEEASLGKDSLPKLAHAVVRAAADKVINPSDKDKNGNDAAAQIYERYVKAESNKAIHEHSSGGKKANVSKLRQLISMGAMTSIDGAEVMQAAFEARERLMAENQKVKAAYPFYVDVAREQLKSDVALTDTQLEEIAAKGEAKEKTLEGELGKILKSLESLVSGENRDKLQDEDELTMAAFEAVRERLEKFATLRARAKLLEDAAALGIKLA